MTAHNDSLYIIIGCEGEKESRSWLKCVETDLGLVTKTPQ